MAHTYRLNKNKDINLLISGERARLLFLRFPSNQKLSVNENKMIPNEFNVCDDKASKCGAILIAEGSERSYRNHKKCTECFPISCTMKELPLLI
jgi:hypothetical protein